MNVAAPPESARGSPLLQALRDPACYPHPVGEVELLETHISHVLLAGEFAYKIKKPVRLPFLDFSTLEARAHFCREELRLNRRTAPQLYLDVVAIGGTPSAPRVGGPGPVLEYAVKMRRFAQDALFSSLARAGALRRPHIDALVDEVVAFHASAAAIAADAGAGEQAAIASAAANFDEMAALDPPAPQRAALESLAEWTRREGERLAATFAQRAALGFVRDCHGDLHLGNVAFLDARPVLFDCLEFSETLRRTDVMADVAFVAMDLARVGLPRLAARFVNRYLERTGDYAGLEVLRFLEVYRAMVRAKVAMIRLAQSSGDAAQAARKELEGLLELARHLSTRAAPAIILMHGLSATGKTTVGERLVEALGAVRLRSDVERKRLHGLDATAPAPAEPGGGIYGERASRDTYERLATLAAGIVALGYPVIVDATFLRRADRDRFRALAGAESVGFQVVACTAPDEVLRARAAERVRAGHDASDAGLAVIEAQKVLLEPLGADERMHATLADTSAGPRWKSAVESFARRFHSHDG
jgi:aminoglycoside phosphotransferase family enzyme/predicted kinase